MSAADHNAAYGALAAAHNAAGLSVPTSVVTDGATDNAAALTSAATAAKAAGATLTLPRHGTVKLASGIKLPYHANLALNDVLIDGQSIASGAVITAAPDSAGGIPSCWDGVTIKANSSSTATCLLIDGSAAYDNPAVSTASAFSSSFRGHTLIGGRDGLGFGNNTWLNEFYNLRVKFQSRYGINGGVGTVAGENFSIYGGVINDVKNVGVTGTGLYVPSTSPRVGWRLFGVSFDYCDRMVDYQSGNLLLSGCHFENANSNWMINVETAVGASTPTSATIISPEFVPGGGGEAGSEPAGGRSTIIRVAGEATVLTVQGGFASLVDKPNTEFVTVASGHPKLSGLASVNYGYYPAINNDMGVISNYLNEVRNGDFETGDLTGWYADPYNFNRNGAMVGGNSGSPGSYPVQWASFGAKAGLTETLGYDFTRGYPVQTLTMTGTPTTSGQVGVYTERNSTNVKAGQYQKWFSRGNFRLPANPVGASFPQIGINQRKSDGSVNTSTSYFPGGDNIRRLYELPFVISANTAYIESWVAFNVTAGTPINVTIELDSPSLMPEGMAYDGSILNDQLTTTLFAPRYWIDPSNARNGSYCLGVNNAGVGNLFVYKRMLGVKPGERVVGRAYFNAPSLTAGGIGLGVNFVDSAGNYLLSTPQPMRAAYITAPTSGYVQHGGCRDAPLGTVEARVGFYASGLNGQAYMDDVWAMRL